MNNEQSDCSDDVVSSVGFFIGDIEECVKIKMTIKRRKKGRLGCLWKKNAEKLKKDEGRKYKT